MSHIGDSNYVTIFQEVEDLHIKAVLKRSKIFSYTMYI